LTNKSAYLGNGARYGIRWHNFVQNTNVSLSTDLPLVSDHERSECHIQTSGNGLTGTEAITTMLLSQPCGDKLLVEDIHKQL